MKYWYLAGTQQLIKEFKGATASVELCCAYVYVCVYDVLGIGHVPAVTRFLSNLSTLSYNLLGQQSQHMIFNIDILDNIYTNK